MRSLAIALLCVAAIRARAQTSAVAASAVEPPIRLWASLTLGPGAASNQSGTRIGAQAALFGSYGQWTLAVRRGAASGIDTGGAYDNALLVGWRSLVPFSTLVVVAGPARIYDDSKGAGRAALGFSAEADANVRAVGLGVSTFGAWRPGRSYIGVGLTLDAGFIL
jgi:hypothetical protein